MLGFAKKDQQNSALTERVRGWTRQRFELADDETVMVSEIACRVPGCPPIETHVVFWTAAGRHHFKVFKPLAAVSEDGLHAFERIVAASYLRALFGEVPP